MKDNTKYHCKHQSGIGAAVIARDKRHGRGSNAGDYLNFHEKIKG